MQIRLFDAQHNLPSNSDTIEEVVDETHIIYEGVNVTGAQHQQSGNQLNVARRCKMREDRGSRDNKQTALTLSLRLTVKSKAGIGVQRLT